MIAIFEGRLNGTQVITLRRISGLEIYHKKPGVQEITGAIGTIMMLLLCPKAVIC